MLGKRLCDNERQIARWKGITSGLKDKVIKTVDGKFDNHAISHMTREVLLHWGYELAENDLFFVHTIMN